MVRYSDDNSNYDSYNMKEEIELQKNPSETAGWFSAITFSWMNSFIKFGSKNKLTEESLYEVGRSEASEKVTAQLEKYWNNEMQKQKNNFKYRPNLLKAMIYAFGPNIGFYSAFLVVQEGLYLFFPFLVGALVQYFEVSNNNSMFYGYKFALLFTAATLIAGPVHHILMYKQQLNGLKMKTAVAGLMYKKAFKLNPSAMSFVSTGKLINLCSTDIARFEWCPQYLHFLISGPLHFMIAACILWREVGIVTLALVYVFFIMFMQTYFARLFTKLRRQTAKISDSRIRLMSEILTGMRIIKMYAWEKPFEKIIYKIRKNEIAKILKSLLLRATNVFLQISSEVIMTFIAFLICVYEQQTMSPAQVFVLLGLFNNLRFTCGVIFPGIISISAECLVAISRIEKVLSLPDNFIEEEAKEDKNETMLSMSDVCARWDKDSNTDVLRNISFNVPEGSLLAIVGPVGSGKSSILSCLLDDLPISSGTKHISNNVAYAPQLPWIFADTIRYNIVFNESYNEKWYNEVVAACGLVKDFKSFKYGDLTLIGERGITLSGGQKARISLARAVYRSNKTDVFLLDDPLSAVDANVGQLLLEKCICGILKKKTRVLVTHQLQYLEGADKIIVLNQGEIIARGSYSDVMATSETDLGLLLSKEVEEVKSDDGFSQTLPEDNESSPILRKRRLTTSSVEPMTKLLETEKDETVVGFEEEDIEEGSISSSVYYEYIKNGANIFVIIFLGLIIILHEVSEVMCMWWFAQWAKNNLYVTNLNTSMILTNTSLVYNGTSEVLQHTNTLPQSYYLNWFVVFLCLELITTFVYTSLHFVLSLRSSVKLHNSMFHSVLNTSIRFFDVNPSGRILNRFSKDIGQLDERLPQISQDFIKNSFRVVRIFVVAAAINYVILLLILPMVIYFVWIRQYFMKTSRALKRMEGTTRSPVYSLLSETLQGLPTIRAFKLQNHLTKQFHKNQDVYGAAFELFSSSSRWFSVRLDIICAIFAGVTAITIVTVEHIFYIDSAKAGVVLINVMGLVDLVQWTVMQSATTESLMTSVERVITYTKLPPEETIDDVTKSDQNNYHNGSIKFVNVYYSHYANGPYVLRNLEFCIKEQEKIGIVGRTGAGKSSLISTLFRMNELEKGDIFIDEVNIKTLPLSELRSSISIIPQDPMLFTGTLRENLDPFSNYSDDELWNVLKQVQLQSLVVELPNKLDSVMHEAGSNLSVGQRQLLCLGRALLKDNKILVVDEATANVDLRTDQLIQKTIRENFSHCTVLTIAHRLNTIIDSDRVMVLDSGQVKEFDHPYLLLQNEEGIFYNMLKSTNIEQFSTLKETASKTYKNLEMID